MRAVAISLIALACTLAAQTPQPAPDDGRPVSWGRMVPNLASDQALIWTFPAKAVRGRHFWPVVAVVGTTALLIATDNRTAPAFRNTTSFHGFNSVFTSTATAVGTVAMPASLYLYGLAAKDSHAAHTALLAGEAAGDAEIVAFALKNIDSRKRPAAFTSQNTFGDSWFEGRNGLRATGSFPSGHAIAAFSIATVVARRYPRHRWVPVVAYGLASVVGFSRITQSAHFPSDVFAGAALGYAIGRFAVVR